MTHASPPASRRQSTRTGKVKQAEIRQKNTPRSRRRSVPRMLLPRITVLVMALALLVGVMVWVHGTGTSASTTDQE